MRLPILRQSRFQEPLLRYGLTPFQGLSRTLSKTSSPMVPACSVRLGGVKERGCFGLFVVRSNLTLQTYVR